MIPDFTTVCAVDARTVDQLHMVWPTWRRHKPELLDHSMVLVCDGEVPDWERRLAWLDHPNRLIIPWKWPYGRHDVTQRERMLTAFVHVPPRVVCTSYWLKLDTDAVASNPTAWIEEEWFRDTPAIVAAPWGYTKPAHFLTALEAWANAHPGLSDTFPLNLDIDPQRETYRHRRIGSWIAFINTTWSATVAAYAPDRLPVPSQDTYHWYCATRMGRTVRRVQFKALGWNNWHKDRTRQGKVDEAMREDVVYC
jgi:hypothetical protein